MNIFINFIENIEVRNKNHNYVKNQLIYLDHTKICFIMIILIKIILDNMKVRHQNH